MQSKMFSKLLSLIYKKKCLSCGCSKSGSLLCENCSKSVEFLPGFAQTIFEDIRVFSATKYEGAQKKLIQSLKFKHKRAAAKILAEILYEYYTKLDLPKDFIIIPVPSHKNRILKRGYCQMDLICKEFSHLSQNPVNKTLLKKIKNTKPQFELKKDERKENLKKSFAIDCTKYNGENLIIIDDVTTTGATIEELINTFCAKNISNINVLTVCKTLNN